MKYNKLLDSSTHSIDSDSNDVIKLDDIEANNSSLKSSIEIENDTEIEDISYEVEKSRNKYYRNILNLFAKFSKFWNILLFGWIKPLLALGNERPLEFKDLLPLLHKDTSEYIYNTFRFFLIEQQKYNNVNDLRNNISLPTILMKSFGKPFYIAGFLKLIHDSCLFIGPVLLFKIIQYIKSPDQPLGLGIFYVMLLFLSQTSMALCLRQYFYLCYRVGMNLRSCVITSVFHKSLDISSSVLSKRSTGEITNLMSVDSTRLQDLTPYLHAIWYSFYQIAIALTLLWLQLGLATLAGTLLIILAIPLNRSINAYLQSIQKKLSVARDNRVKICGEVFVGIKIIKFQSWEDKYRNKINDARKIELDLLYQYMIGQSYAMALYISIPLLVSMSTFTMYSLLGNKELDVSTTLTSLALFDLLRFPLYMLPNVINNFIEAKISVDRLENFLNEPDRAIIPNIDDDEKNSKNENVCVLMKNATFVWDNTTYRKKKLQMKKLNKTLLHIVNENFQYLTNKSQVFLSKIFYYRRDNEIVRIEDEDSKSSKELEIVQYIDKSDDEYKYDIMMLIQNESNELINKLENQFNNNNNNSIDLYNNQSNNNILTLFHINLSFHIGQLVGVIGSVGSGKSSLLSAILGEIKLYNGIIKMKNNYKIAYVNQKSFIQNNTLRENILFGLEYDDSLYNQVLSDCCLLQDLSILPAGDMTEIGERGINISGGQKARISLARALYSNNDIYLLDDPLSAVDAHVGQHLFDHCILKLKSLGKCVILVTNALQYIKYMDDVIVLDNGRIVEHGIYDRLMSNSNGRLYSMMLSHQDSIRTSDPSNNNESENSSTEIVEIKLNNNKSNNGKLISAEDRETGEVNFGVYKMWLVSSGGLIVGIIFITLCIIGEGSNILGQWWISQLSVAFGSNRHTVLTSKWFNLFIYALINIFIISIVTAQELYIRKKSMNSSKKLFSDMLTSILYAPMSFYDTTPLGRISNRFVKDIYTIDELLPRSIRSYSSNIIKIFSVLLYICIVIPYFLLFIIPIFIFYYKSQKYYIKTSRELSRLDSISRSPIYALFSESLDGLSTIRAYRIENIIIQKLYKLLNTNQQAFYLNFSANCWLGIRLDCVGALIVSCTALFAVLVKQQVLYNYDQETLTTQLNSLAILTGLAISLSLNCTQSLNWSVRMASDLESQMISVERIHNYTNIQQEACHYQSIDNMLASWPNQEIYLGVIEFFNVSMKYRDHLPYVLKNLSFKTNSHEKIGIVGRTGAGKSSIVTILLRLVEITNGTISIDNIDISTIGLNKLRTSIAVIPQDPVLFSGTIRSNLDPFDLYTDTILYTILSNCQLNDFKLDMVIEENGSNLSIGQRQLICIARALISHAKIIIMDEATASIDIQTDKNIQKTMKEQFSHCTCITIAHRLNTILDSDRIMVMNDGYIVEFDTPNNLLNQKTSMFSSLVNNWDHSNN